MKVCYLHRCRLEALVYLHAALEYRHQQDVQTSRESGKIDGSEPLGKLHLILSFLKVVINRTVLSSEGVFSFISVFKE